MISKEELKVVNVFRNGLFREFSVKDIMNEMKKNSYSWVFNSVKKLLSLDLIKFSEKAGVKMYSINWNNPLIFRYFSLLDYDNISNLPMKNIFDLISSSSVKYFTLIVGGSYVCGKNVKGSDLDVVVIVENKVDVKKMFNVLKNKSLLMIPKVDLYVFSRKEFLEMLLDNQENLGKQFFEKGLILFGSESYYQIVMEAEKNGFRG